MHASQTVTERTVAVLKAVAHPLRLGILAILCEGDEHVTGLADRLGASRSAVSGSLALMRMLHIVAVSRRNGHATYRLQDDGLRELISWAWRPASVDRAHGAAVSAAGHRATSRRSR